MVVMTSIFVAEFERPLEAIDADLLDLNLQVARRASSYGSTARELIGMYEGKNRVEPIE